MLSRTSAGISVDTSKLGRKIVYAVVGVILLWAANKMVFSVNNHEVAALTYPNGHVEYYFAPGVYCQCMGHVEFFEKRTPYAFEEHIQFNDGAHGTIKGTVQYQVPMDQTNFGKMYQLYPSPEQIQKGVIESNLQKAVYLTGRMMSSKESYAERRGDLLSYMEDQLKHGPYQTKSYTKEIDDDLDKTKKKLISVVDIIADAKGPGGLGRQEVGLEEQFNIQTSNFNFTVTYDGEVEKQIQAMQRMTQAIQQSIAEAKQAEQNAITIAKNGEATAASAKWEQEKINAKNISEAQMRVDVAAKDKDAAALKKQTLILEGEGEAEKKRLIMNADGALQQKLATYEKVQSMWAEAFKGYQGSIVPQIQTGGATGNGALNFQDLMSMKALRDLSLDLGVKGNGGKK